MSDVITIRRCVLRIRRLGGWSWGPDPDALLGAATRALPRLIADHVRGLPLAHPTGTVRIAAPIRLRVTTTVDELAALAAAARTGEGVASSSIARRLDQAVAAALAASDLTLAPEDEAATVTSDPIAEPAALHHVSGEGLLALLGRWSRERVVLEILAAAPPEVLVTWLAQITASLPIRSASDEVSPHARPAVELAIAVARELGAEHGGPLVVLAALGTVVAAMGAPSDRRIVDDVLAAVAAITTTNAAAHDTTREQAADHDLSTAAHVRAATGSPTRPEVAPVASHHVVRGPATGFAAALPFLALVPLARCGWLAALAATLEAADAMDLGPVIASALAYKLADPPEHGWLRRTEHRETAAALAGTALSDAELYDAQSRLAPLAKLLIAPITAELRRGHRRGAPLLLARGADDHALVDTEGTFVIARAREAPIVLDAARGLGDLVLVPAAIATARLLDQIECSNLVFVTDAPPDRGQPWRIVPRARLWTNDGGQLERHAQLADVLADGAALAGELLDVLHARPALPRTAPGPLDQIASQAAALALGDLAWTLFRDRETPTPVLALERFATLDARVTSDAARIEVRIPIGRRHADLLAHGYLTTIDAVPWFDQRVLHIMGG